MRSTSTILLSMSLVLFACGGGAEDDEVPTYGGTGEAPSTSPAAESPAANTEAAADAITIKRADGEKIATVSIDGDRVSIAVLDRAEKLDLVGKIKDSGKRKYESGGSVVAEVKPSDSGFKVRTPDGALLWKVKISDDKIKISDNEENRDPWVLSGKHENRVKILDPRENEIGAVKFYPDRNRVEVKDASNAELFKSNTDRESAAYGVLMMSSIPLQERYIILSEILVRGR